MSHPQIRPSVFAGGAQWLALHSYAASFTPTAATKRAAKNYVNSMAVLFPCKDCREHFIKFMEHNDINLYLDSPHRFFLWTYLAHDGATRAKGEQSPPYNETKRYYFESLHGTCDKCG